MALPDGDPGRAVDSIRRGVERGEVAASNEVSVRLAWELVQLLGQRASAELPPGASPPGGAGNDPERVLRQVELANPWEWRVHWAGRSTSSRAATPPWPPRGFSRVWTELTGRDRAEDRRRPGRRTGRRAPSALELYDLVISSDSSFVSAAFGLARCNWHLDNHEGVVSAFNRVPTSSAAHSNAQVAAARALVHGGPDGDPELADLRAASDTIERLQLDAAERAALAADIFERALAGVEDGRISTSSGTMLGRPLTEKSLREGLEQTYRTQARLATSPEQRVRLVDRANAVRPRSLF